MDIGTRVTVLWPPALQHARGVVIDQSDHDQVLIEFNVNDQPPHIPLIAFIEFCLIASTERFHRWYHFDEVQE
jgi:hypothetical protein